MIARRMTLKPRREAASNLAEAGVPLRDEELVYVIDETGHWVLVPPHPGDIFCNPFLNFTEWDSEEDEKGYANL